MRSRTARGDRLRPAAFARRANLDRVRLAGRGVYELIGPDGQVKARGTFANLITDHGDQYYAERAETSPAAIASGMRLGTGTTAVAKSGAGSAIVTYVSGSNLALDAGPAASSLGAGLGWTVEYVATWAPGVATATGIAEAVITDETPLTNVAGVAGNTISRALLSPAVNKGALDQLVITWNHDALGA
jgi:hypothetical protein